MLRVGRHYGNAALFVPYGTGSYSQINGRQTAQRLTEPLRRLPRALQQLLAGPRINVATPTVYGTLDDGQPAPGLAQREVHPDVGLEPERDARRHEHASSSCARRARRGARIVCIDPRMTPSAVALADEWIPIRPGTDAAMMTAMAHVMITERAARRRRSCGRTASASTHRRCRRAARARRATRDYILGTRDGVPKTPAWAERDQRRCRATTIARIAREYATTKPGVLYQGYGMQRRAYGEQVVRAGCVLAAITGNVGVPGGWAGGLGAPGARRRAAVERLPDRRRTRSRRASRRSSGPRRSCAGTAAGRRARRARRANARQRHQAHLRRRVERAHQPARQHQPHREDPAGRVAGRVHRRPGQLPDADARGSPTSSCRPARSSRRGASRTAGSTATKCS